MGCGRTGSTLAQMVEDRGHTVAVVDQNPDAFRRLGAHFEGRRVVGAGFDRDTLIDAGIEEAYALTDLEPDPERCMAEAGPLLERLAARIAADRLPTPGAAPA